ncbi:MAG: hypothetical protein LHW57_08290 [Candidatus Cloacimonetes bacterium]|nr:hypothetical protein [Candidatus Cloacimonadota bacterium]
MKNNLGVKIIALLMAVFIWLQVTLVSQHESVTGLNLKLVNASGADTLRQPPGKISSTVKGRGLDILRLKYSKAYIQMEAADYWAGNASDFLAVDIPEQLNVEVLEVVPPSLSEQRQETARAGSETAPGRAAPAAQTRSEADAAGPSSAPEEEVQTRILTDLSIDTPRGLTVFPARATLKVRGKASLLAGLPGGIRVYIVNEPDPRGQYAVKAELPDGISLQDITPRQVRAAR